VARKIAKTPVRVAWAAVCCSIALGATLWTTSGGAQLPEAMPPLRARTALKQAHDLYKRGDYENAARFYEQAQAAQGDLTLTERHDLTKLSQQNSVALQARRDGAALLRQAEEALRQNKTQEAGKLLRAATANQYLSGEDRQRRARLSSRGRTRRRS
jgi:hypothetical protein